MATIDNFELPETLVLVMKQKITEMDPDAILAFAKSYPSWSKGFRLINKNVESFRQRMQESMFSEGKEIPKALLKFLSFNDLNLELISKLPPESLELFLYDFQDYYGEEQYLICLLLDEREEVRKLALQCIEESGDENEESDVDREETQEHEDNNAEHNQQLKELKELLAQERREIASTLKRNKRLEGKIQKLKEDLSFQRELFLQQKKKTESAHTKAVTLQHELDKLSKNLEDKIHDGVTAEIRSTINTWLVNPLEINAYVKNHNSDTLLDKVEQALEKQARIDKHSGNLRILKERLGALEQARELIDKARKEALQVLPQLAPLSKDLDKAITEIYQKISGSAEENKLLAPWLVKINESPSSKELHGISQLIYELHGEGIFTDHDVQILRKRIHQVRDRLIDHWKYPESEVELSTSHHTLIVDGHNVVLGPDSFYLFNGQNTELTEPEKRKLLTGMNIKAFGDMQNVTVMIYFDSPTFSQHKVTSNIKEIFSGGGQEDQRADNAIIEFLQNRRSDSLTNKYILITDDRELSSRAEKLGAEVVSVFEYGVMLRQQSVHSCS